MRYRLHVVNRPDIQDECEADTERQALDIFSQRDAIANDSTIQGVDIFADAIVASSAH